MPRLTKLAKKQEEIKHLDIATQAIINRIDKNDRRLRVSAYSFLTVLLIIGIIGLFYQNHIAAQNQKHIDCIVKLFSSPLPSNAHSRQISNPESTCNIKFTT